MNPKYSKETIKRLIKNIDSKIADKVELIAIGGTALALTNDRPYSNDIDLCYGNLYPPEEIAQIILDAAREEGISKLDIFEKLEMSLLNIPDFAERAIPFPELSSERLSFKIMHPEDIALHKIYRGELRDRDDVRNLILSEKIDLQSLRHRFNKIIKFQDLDVRQEFIEKFEAFIKGYSS
jgi:hypothetical protein